MSFRFLPGVGSIKGPSLKHQLRTLRAWTCPNCQRIVRDDGTVTSRRCECSAQTWMLLTDEPRYDPVDVSPFVTYLDPEFADDDDDGTDLPVPDLETLRPPPRPDTRRPRSSTRPPADEVPKTDDDAGPPDEASGEPQPTKEMNSSDERPEEVRPKRRRRRGRRRSPQQRPAPAEESSNITSDQRQIPDPASPGLSDSTDAAPETDRSTPPRKNRRRRGRRPRGNEPAS